MVSCDTCDELVGVLDIGDNHAVNAEDGNFKGASFWLIMCTKSLRKVKKAFTNRWGKTFDEGDDAVVGLYYQKWGNNEFFMSC